MPDESPPDESPDQFDAEVNDLLAEAESMSAEIAAEVGSTPTGGEKRERAFFETETDSEQSLEHQLSQASDAVEAAASELGAEPAKPKKRIALPPKKGAAGAGGVADAAAAPPSQPQTIVLPQRSASPSGGEEDLSADRLVAGSLAETPFELTPPRTGLLARVKAHIPAGKLARARTASAQVAASTLEALDRPFGWVGYRPRALLGWLALLLTVAAAALYCFAVC